MGKEFRGGRGGGRGRGRGGPGGKRDKPNWNEPPEEVTLVGDVMHAVEGHLLVKCILKDKVPIFNRPAYIQDKKKIGMIDEVLGPINEYVSN